MIPFLLGIVFSLGLTAAGYLIYRLRFAKPPNSREAVPPALGRPPLPPSTPNVEHVADLAREQIIAINRSFPQDLMNLESAIDLKKVFPDGPPSKQQNMRSPG